MEDVEITVTINSSDDDYFATRTILTVNTTILNGIGEAFLIYEQIRSTRQLEITMLNNMFNINNFSFYDPQSHHLFRTPPNRYVEWNQSTQNWSEYLETIGGTNILGFHYLGPALRSAYTYSILFVDNYNSATVYIILSLDFIRGMITLFNWTNLNYHHYIKYIVRHTDEQLMAIQ